MKGLGYQQVGDIYPVSDRAEAPVCFNDTRHFAKRQLTWFRKEPGLQWWTLSEQDSPEDVAGRLLEGSIVPAGFRTSTSGGRACVAHYGNGINMTTSKKNRSGGHRHHRREWVVQYRRIGTSPRGASAHPVWGSSRMPWRGVGGVQEWRFSRGMAGGTGSIRKHQLPRQHLRAEITGCEASDFSQRGREHERGYSAWRCRVAGSIHRSYQTARIHLSMTALWPTLVSANRSVPRWPIPWRKRDGLPGRVFIGEDLCVYGGPQFSTKAESRLYRQWSGRHWNDDDAHARRSSLAKPNSVTPRWRCRPTMTVGMRRKEAVTVEAILATLHKNVALAKQVLKTAVPKLDPDRACLCHQGAWKRHRNRSGSHVGCGQAPVESL